MRSSAPLASALRSAAPAGTMSSSRTGTPALAIWAAMPEPMTPAPITAARWIAIRSPPARSRSPGRRRCTGSRDAKRLALALHERCRLAGDPGAGGAERMAERHGAAVEVEGPLVDPEIAHAGQRLRSERLIELDHLDVADLEPGAGQRFPRRGDRPDAHDLGGAAGDRDAPDAGQHVEPVLVGVILGADQHRGRPVGQRRGGAGGHRAMLVERGLEVGERRLAGLRADAAVGLDRPAVAPDRHDLGRELARGLRRCGLAVAQSAANASWAPRVI